MSQNLEVDPAVQNIIVDAPEDQVVDVRSFTQRIIVNPDTQVISVINAGPQGPPGPAGPPGGGPETEMTFTQGSPSDEWTINHNFGFYPNIDVYTVGGQLMLGQVVNISVNQVKVYFNTPVAGSARVS